jgi:alpha-beta hydrolase superfamily lysophospholipase
MIYDQDRVSSFLGANGELRYINIWEHSIKKCVIISIHGGLSNGGDFINVGQYFRNKGAVILSFDMRGHADSKKAHIQSFDYFLSDLEVFIKWVETNYPGLPIFLLGHSMGALIVANFRLKKKKGYVSISGYIMSSPYFEGIRTPTKKQNIAFNCIAELFPKLNFPIVSHVEKLTHDKNITKRIILDKKLNIRSSKISIKFVCEIIKAQDYLKENFHRWDDSLFVVIAGDESLSNPVVTHEILNTVHKDLIELEFYPENYHENFNELNRFDIFQKIQHWLITTHGVKLHNVTSVETTPIENKRIA